MDNYLDKKRFNSYYLLQANDTAHYLRMTARRLSSQHLKNLISHINFNNEVDRFIEAQIQGIKKATDERECKLCLYNLQEEKKLLHHQDAALRTGAAKIAVSAELVNNHLDTLGYFVNGVGLVIGTGQVIAGIGFTTAGLLTGNVVGVFAGVILILHGTNNLQEGFVNLRDNRSDTSGFMREQYVKTAEFLGLSSKAGQLSYSAVDLVLSGYGLGRMLLKPDAWRLFHYIPADYIRSFRTMGAPSLALEMLGDGITVLNIYESD